VQLSAQLIPCRFFDHSAADAWNVTPKSSSPLAGFPVFVAQLDSIAPQHLIRVCNTHLLLPPKLLLLPPKLLLLRMRMRMHLLLRMLLRAVLSLLPPH
jgi:hypothetical protein